jgi:hypothetical protein
MVDVLFGLRHMAEQLGQQPLLDGRLARDK